MASPTLSSPRGSFTRLSVQLQRRLQSSSVPALPPPSPFPRHLFKPPSSIIKPWKVIAGAQEWQSSTYHYNKNTTKTFPTAAATADKLLQDFSTIIVARDKASDDAGKGSSSSNGAKNSIAVRRRSAEKMFVSGTTVKDYGDRIVVNAFMFDGVEAAKDEMQARDQARKLAREGPQRQGRRTGAAGGAGGGAGAGGGGGAGPGGRRRPPFRSAAGTGAGLGARSSGSPNGRAPEPAFRRVNLTSGGTKT